MILRGMILRGMSTRRITNLDLPMNGGVRGNQQMIHYEELKLTLVEAFLLWNLTFVEAYCSLSKIAQRRKIARQRKIAQLQRMGNLAD